MKGKSVCNKENFKFIFDNHSESLRNFIFYKCGNLEISEDLVQEAFIKLWQNCRNIVFEKAKSYIFTVANNAMLNQIAHQKVILKYRNSITENSDIKDPLYYIEQNEFDAKLQTALSNLPEKQRQTFLLSRIDKKTYQEISEIFNISIKAVEKRIHKALIQLRNELGDYF